MQHRLTGNLAEPRAFDWASIISPFDGAKIGGRCVAAEGDEATIEWGGMRVTGLLKVFVPRDDGQKPVSYFQHDYLAA